MKVMHARRMTKDEHAAVIARSLESDYQRWRREHPTASTLEQLAETYRIGSEELRRVRR